MSAGFYVPVDSTREAIRAHSSFNLVDTQNALKVDLFVVGDGLLDRMQIQRRVRIVVPGSPEGIWVTSPEDQVLRKLDWFRQSDSMSDREWRDVVGILRVHGAELDDEYLSESALALGPSPTPTGHHQRPGVACPDRRRRRDQGPLWSGGGRS